VTIDDERVITLLHDAVPAVPDLPDRVDAIRRRAGRQRAQVWTQTIGAVAAVVVLVGLASAVAAPRGGTVRPAGDPLKNLAATFAAQPSVKFEITTQPTGSVVGTSRLPASVATQVLTSHATGAVARSGEFHIDGDLSALVMLGEDSEFADTHIVSAGGAVYRPISKYETSGAGAGKKWVREALPRFSPADIQRVINLGLAFTDDVRYVGPAVVRDTNVAEYALTLPARYAGGESLTIRFALDRDGRPRRIETDVDLLRLFGGIDDSDPAAQEAVPSYRVHVQLDLFGYGSAVSVTAPPESEVVDEQTLFENQDSAPVSTECSPEPPSPSPSPGFEIEVGCAQTGTYVIPAQPTPVGSPGSAGWSGYGLSGTDSATATPVPAESSPAP
jgi:hypothetical protein